ncbi:MAG: alanine racemase [Gammaproteobacteria bacterium SG8_47]|nr:MAG: alanine racemase [Gammaproteobacteria bacterium SG8_47]
MTRPARAVISLSALQHNLRAVREAAPQARVMAVVKADGYGHGICSVARGLESADGFAVACMDEAVGLREAGFSKPITVLGGFSTARELDVVRSNALDVVVHHESQLTLLEGAAIGDPIVVWLKIDTGMHRLGFGIDAARAAYERLRNCRAVVQPVRLLTHLACADDRDDPTTAIQLQEFARVSAASSVPRSIANSGGILGWPDSHADWVRPGIMLYGVSPFCRGIGAELGLRPVMTLRSELIAVNRQARGARIGYGGTWQCPEDMPVGVVAIGYGDGYPRHASSDTPILVNGKRVALIGRVSMDMVTVDLRTQPQAHPGDPVVLWGDGLPVEEVAASAGTIAYELLCGVTRRVKHEVVLD